ncbi:MAG: magnesium chelatase subunit D family protein [Methanoregula sp.]
MTTLYPFPAITDQENAKKALQCMLVDDDIRTILIMGDPGTAKSTLARSVGALVFGKKVLTVPQNITYDRLLGNLELESAVSTGRAQLAPGILEQGNCQILYADNINLMDEGIVTTLLNTSETGQIILEREGFSHRARTRFILIATMDPAEGELTSSQMDHFDLCVRLDPIEDSGLRADVVRKHLRFEQSPDEFIREYEPRILALKKTIDAARERLPYVSIPEGHADLISSLCLELGVAGQRGDLAVARAAKALAALDCRDSVEFDDIKLASLFALEHRRRDIPHSPQSVPPQKEPDTKDQEQKNGSGSSDRNTQRDQTSDTQPERQEQKDTDKEKTLPPPPQEQVFGIGSSFEVIRYLNEKSRRATHKQKSGKRSRIISTNTSGHYCSFRLPKKNRHDIAIDATLRAAAPYQQSRERNGLAISVKKMDLREKIREKKTAHTILFLVDASGSMGARKRMVAVKGAIRSLLTDAYQKRDRIGLMIFRGTDARLVLPPTRSPDLAVRMLRTLPTGGMTPLIQGIAEAYGLLTRGRYAAAGENKSIVILTDGRVNVSMNTKSPYNELADMARSIAGTGIRFVVVDTEIGFPCLGRARALAGDLEASYFRLEDLNSRRLTGTVQELIYTTR